VVDVGSYEGSVLGTSDTDGSTVGLWLGKLDMVGLKDGYSEGFVDIEGS